MKKIYFAFFVMAVLMGRLSAQCTIDTAAFTAGVIVSPSSLSITPGIGFSGAAGLLVPDSVDASAYDTLLPPNIYYVYLDSIFIDSLAGAPTGITNVINPNGIWLHPGQFACLQFFGTTTAASGIYTISAFGGACLHGTISNQTLDSCQTGQLPSPAFFNFGLIVGPAPACIPDTTAQPRAGISPPASQIPCIVTGEPFNQTIQVQCPTYFDTLVNLVITSYPLTVTVDSIELDSIINLPAGITWVKYPNKLRGGQNGCLTFSGTTNAPTGYYHLTWYGTAWVTEPSGLGNKTVTGSLNRYPYVDYYLNVVHPGDSCIPYNPYSTNGINTIDPTLNASILVSPNPSNGNCILKINAGSRLTGKIEVSDVTGKIIYSQNVDLIGQQNISIDLSNNAKGIYNILLKTANGNAAKRISID